MCRTAREPKLVHLCDALTGQSVQKLYTLIITYRPAREPSLVHLSGVLTGQYCCVCCIVLLTLCYVLLFYESAMTTTKLPLEA